MTHNVPQRPLCTPSLISPPPLPISSRGPVASFIVMDVMRAAAAREAQGLEVLHLEVGQPATSAPAGARAAAIAAIERDVLGYTTALGTTALREGLSAHIADWYGVPVGAEEIIITMGASGAFPLAFLAAFNRGDRIALASPSYPAYRNILVALEMEPVLLPATATDRYQPSLALLDAADGPIHGLIVASPSNPAGTMLPDADFRALLDHCKARGIRVISDEIYHGMAYGTDGAPAQQRGFCAWAHDRDVVVINSFSKYFSMTGWRVGWMLMPTDLAGPIERLSQNMVISATSPAQAAALGALNCHDELAEHLARYARNREVLLQGLDRIGITTRAPADGAFYIYANIGHLSHDSAGFCRQLLDDTGIAITPGLDFDPQRGHDWIRLSFAGATETMQRAVALMAVWVQRG